MKTSFVTADFASFEDFISRLILVPRDDDLCIGAKVASHNVPAVIAASCEDKVHPADEEKRENQAGNPRTRYNSDDAKINNSKSRWPVGSDPNIQDAKEDSAAHIRPQNEVDDNVQDAEEDSAAHVRPQNEVHGNLQDAEEDSEGLVRPQNKFDDSLQDSDENSAAYAETQNEVDENYEVPSGYVLVRITTSNDDDNNDMQMDLEGMEFSELFSVLRGAAFPLSLMFAPPTENSTHNTDSQNGTFSATMSTPGPLDVEEDQSGEDDDPAKTGINELAPPSSTLVSREDAAKYAKLAATELRGRLSRWGYQAATLAADAATQVKELRDEKLRKANEEQQHHNIQNSQPGVFEEKIQDDLPIDASNTPFDMESREGIDIASSTKTPVELCSIFIQTPLGFEPIQRDALSSITTNSVISFRLTKDKACPIGKNGYAFQWYRSNIDGVINDVIMQSFDSESDYKALPGWSLLRGACYAAYQPSVSDVGRQLLCIIKHEDTFLQCCSMPYIVVLEQSLFDSAKKSLFGGQRSISFCNLEGLDDRSRFRLKIDVVSNDDFISSSAIFLERVAGTSADESYVEKERITHFRADADPAKPRLFDLTCSSHGKLRLDAANRKSRESLVLALGLANFKGKLTSLTNETALFASCESDDAIPLENELSSTDKNSLLVAKFNEMNSLLLTKEFAIAKLQQALLDSDARTRKIEEDLGLSRDAERHLNSLIQSLESRVTVQARKIEALGKAQTDAVTANERAVKALKNEKAVLQAAIEARDGKIDGLATQLSDLVERSSLQTEQVLSIEILKNDVRQANERHSLAERMIVSMKEKEVILNLELASTKETALKYESRCIELKSSVSKCESDCKKIKMERNSLRQRIDGLSKEMLRMSKNNLDSIENEKLKGAIQELGRERIYLLGQIDIVKNERRDALDKLHAVQAAHQQSVRFQRSPSTEIINGSSVLDRIGELEGVIASMTDYLSAKDMQIETLKQVNEAILNDNRN
jgi:hypothetical protein